MDNTKMGDAADIQEERNAIQGDLDRLESWAHVNFMKFNKIRGNVLDLGQGDPRHECRLGNEWT